MGTRVWKEPVKGKTCPTQGSLNCFSVLDFFEDAPFTFSYIVPFPPFIATKLKQIHQYLLLLYCAISSTLNFTLLGCVWKGVGARMHACEDHQSTSGTIPQEGTALFLR